MTEPTDFYLHYLGPVEGTTERTLGLVPVEGLERVDIHTVLARVVVEVISEKGTAKESFDLNLSDVYRLLFCVNEIWGASKRHLSREATEWLELVNRGV